MKIAYAGLALFSACPPHLGDGVYELQLRLWIRTEILLQSTIPHSSGTFRGFQARVLLAWCCWCLLAAPELEVGFGGRGGDGAAQGERLLRG